MFVTGQVAGVFRVDVDRHDELTDYNVTRTFDGFAPLREDVPFFPPLSLLRDERYEQPNAPADVAQDLFLPAIAWLQPALIEPDISFTSQVLDRLAQRAGSVDILAHVADEDAAARLAAACFVFG